MKKGVSLLILTGLLVGLLATLAACGGGDKPSLLYFRSGT